MEVKVPAKLLYVMFIWQYWHVELLFGTRVIQTLLHLSVLMLSYSEPIGNFWELKLFFLYSHRLRRA